MLPALQSPVISEGSRLTDLCLVDLRRSTKTCNFADPDASGRRHHNYNEHARNGQISGRFATRRLESPVNVCDLVTVCVVVIIY